MLAGLAIALASCANRQAKTSEAENEYIDASVCAQCHAGQARTYSKTGMARAFYVPDSASVPDPKPFLHRASATWYQVVGKEEAWYQQWWQTGLKGQKENAGESKIDYVMGSGNHVRTYLHRTARGTLIELPLAWYAEKGGSWALNPGFDMSDPPAGRKIGYDCMFCHNSYPTIPPGIEDPVADPRFAGHLPQGIDCQRCHGPGGNHVRAVRQPGAKPTEIRAAIVNPAKLGKERAMEVCMQCHLETTSAPLPNAIRRFDRGPFSYRPGEPLSAFQLIFDHAPGSGREAKFEIVNSVYRLRQSRCFLESKGALACTACHNPHDIKHGQEGLDGYNKACVGCHEPSKIAAQAHPSGANCVGCHMPKRRAEDVVHAVMTDHLIQRRPPANLLAEFPERHDSGLVYKGEVVPYGDRDDLYTAVAQVSQVSNLEGGIPRLQAEIARSKLTGPDLYRELGDALQRAGRSEDAVAAYRLAIEKRPGSAVLWARLAQPLRAQGKSKEPLDAMLNSVRMDPNQPSTWNDLGLLQSDLGDKQSAIESFRKSIVLDPEVAESHNSLGAALMETGQAQEAEIEFRQALRIRPALAAAHANLGYLFANRGDLAEAAWNFERAGDGPVVQFSYGVILARMNRTAGAMSHLERSLQTDPKQPVAHEFLGRLLESAGKVDAAVSHYKEAIQLQPNFGRPHIDLAALLLRAGNRAGAAQEFQAAMSDADPQVRELAAKGLAAAQR